MKHRTSNQNAYIPMHQLQTIHLLLRLLQKVLCSHQCFYTSHNSNCSIVVMSCRIIAFLVLSLEMKIHKCDLVSSHHLHMESQHLSYTSQEDLFYQHVQFLCNMDYVVHVYLMQSLQAEIPYLMALRK